MIDLNSTAMRRDQTVKLIHEAIDASLVSKAVAQKPRTYLGASSIGDPCQRRIQHRYMGASPDETYEPNPRIQRIFHRGHVAEDWTIMWLREAGYEVVNQKPGGGQLGFSTANGKFAGHCDGVIMSGPGIEQPALFEHKCVGAKSWRAMDKHGVAKAKPEYADQIAIYQAYLDFTGPAVFIALNADTMELYIELIKFDAKRAQDASDRAVSIIQDTEAGAMRPRVSDDPDFWLCRGCEFRGRCHD